LFGHPLDEKRFYKFIWACVDNPAAAPDEISFRERLERDTKLPRDAQGFPHHDIAKAQSLFNHLIAFAKARP